MRYDVVVAGLGAMGSATAYQLARRVRACSGVDRYRPPHTLGSTHGDTRITRVAIGEGLAYVPAGTALARALAGDRARDRVAAPDQCGGLVMAPPQATFAMHGSESFLEHTVAAAEAYGVEHERLGTADLAARFPQFALAGDEQGCYEPGAGFVRPEAGGRGAAPAGPRRWAPPSPWANASSATTTTARTSRSAPPTETVEASALVVTAGPWVPELVPELAPW